MITPNFLLLRPLMRVYYDLSQLPRFQKAIVTIGSFDGLHAGHRRILEQVANLARQVAGESVVVTFDPHPRTVVGTPSDDFKLLTTTAEKIDLIRATGVQNLVVVPFTQAFAQNTATQYVDQFLLQHFEPHTIVIGYDHRFGNDRQGNLQFLQNYADHGRFRLIEIPAQEVDDITVSSSKIRRAIEAADMDTANRLLGHTFTLSGTVVLGNQIGRTIGFPTANVDVGDATKLIPPQGIYAATCPLPTTNGQGPKNWPAMLYIGERPSIPGATGQRVEVNILGFDGDLYGQQLTVEVHGFIRGDKKLDGLDALKAQIAEDQKAIEARLGLASQQPDDSDVAVVILNYNTRAQLEQYLPSVVAYSGNARIVVADNGSPDDSIDFVQKHYPQIQVVDLQQNWGFAEGYNRALLQVQAEYYILLNSDVEVTPNWTRPILDAMRNDPSIGIAQPKILAERQRDQFEYAGAAGGWMDYLGYPFCRGRIFNYVETDQGQYDTPQACFWATGAAYFIRSEVYHGLGGFDGDYFAHNEEIDLCWRAKRAGFSVWCFPQSTVFHLGGGTLGYESPRKVFLNFRNSLFTLLKNERTLKLLWLIPARMVLDGLAGGMFLVKKQPASVKAILQAHFSFYGQFFKFLKKRSVAAQLVKATHLPNKKIEKSGIYHASIVFAHYLRRIKAFSDLPFIGK